MPILRIKLPNNKGEVTHVVSGDRISVGRRSDNTIQIIDTTVSGYHAELIGYHGEYRLRDLGSTNRTSVNGEPVTDFQLNKDCKISFGTVECEFSLTTPASAEGVADPAPTRSEMDYLRRENLDLQAQIVAQKKQIDILSSARLVTKEQAPGVGSGTHNKVAAERDELLKENEQLKRDLEHLRGDVLTIRKDRDALRQAWEMVKAELAEAQKELTLLRDTSTARASEAPVTERTAAAV